MSGVERHGYMDAQASSAMTEAYQKEKKWVLACLCLLCAACLECCTVLCFSVCHLRHPRTALTGCSATGTPCRVPYVSARHPMCTM